MNDESVSFKVYRANDKVLQRPVLQELESSVDRLYIWSLRRKSASSFDIRIQGYLLEPKLNEESRKRWFNVMPVCDDKRMELSFDLWNQSSSSYLLDQARLILMNVEDKQYYDMIIHLPFAHDYLLRVSSEKLENKDKKTLSIFNDARILVISNPFFGIRSSMQVRPIFVNSTYYVPSNYFPERSMIRCYYIDQKVKERANKPPENFLFNYRVKSEEKKRSVIQEHELNTIYTFGLLRFQGLIQAVFYNDPILMAGEYFTNTLNYGSPS